MNGFTYNGIHSDTMRVGYAPSVDSWQRKQTTYEIADTDTPGRDGGYFYFSRYKTRDFSLSCWVEDVTINQWERIKRWLDKSTNGRLIFDDTPFMYYNVRPTKALTHKFYPAGNGLISGTFTITFTAYDPAGYLLYDRLDVTNSDCLKAAEYCDLLLPAFMPEAPDKETKDFLLYNCGTAPCDTTIRISGLVNDTVKIQNLTNSQTCTLIPLEGYERLPVDDNGAGAYLEIDSYYGYVKLLGLGSPTYAFAYHDDGFIRLEPARLEREGLRAATSKGSNVVAIAGIPLNSDYAGRYIWLDGGWHKILYVSLANGANNVVIDTNAASDGTVAAMIATLNRIQITGFSKMDKLEVEYTPKMM